MRWQYLREFLVIAEAGSINAAAKRLGVSQPALSRSIRELERDLGSQLFDRRKTGAVLTPLGKLFARRAALAVNEIERGKEELKQVQGAVYGSIVTCLSSMIQVELFREAIGAFHLRYPNVIVEMIEGTYPAVNGRLRRGEVDFYIGPVPPQDYDYGLHIENLFRTRRVVLARKGHPLVSATTLKDLQNAGWIITQTSEQNEEDFARVFSDAGCEAPRVLVKIDTALTWMSSLMDSDLLVMVPEQWAHSPLIKDLYVKIELEEEIPSPVVALVKRSATPLTPASEYFCDLLRRPAERILSQQGGWG